MIAYKVLIFSFFASLTYLLSCGGDEELNTFSGTITDMSSGQPVEGVTVYLDASTISSGSVSSAFVQIAQTTTDASGKYLFECENKTYLKFRLRFSKNGYHSSSEEFNPVDQVAQYTKDHSFARESYILINIHNQNPIHSDDQFKVRVERINQDCESCCSDDFHYFYGESIDTSFMCNTVGGDSVKIFTISIHEDETHISETIKYCIPGDTVFHDCFY